MLYCGKIKKEPFVTIDGNSHFVHTIPLKEEKACRCMAPVEGTPIF